jgi:flavin-dependent dehydrogenase
MKTDVLIVGGGPAGATAAMCLINEGLRPVIVEAETFPRYHIGESMTGEAGQMMRGLGLESEMIRRQYPVKCGVKVYGKSATGSWYVPVCGRDQNGQLLDWETWQVRRSDFDKMMLDTALARGATLVHGKAIHPVLLNGAVKGARVRMRDGREQIIESEMLLDCSGQATWLANLGGVTGPKYLGAYDKQIAIFSQVRGAVRDQGTARDQRKDNTLIFYQQKYHWAWFIPIDHEVVSVGVVVPSAYFQDKRESKGDFLLRELHELHPELRRRLPAIDLVEDVHVIPNYSYQVKNFCGNGFICIGDAHRFIDPIFSFGITMAVREARLAAPVVRAWLEGKGREQSNPFSGHQLFCEKGLDVLEDMLDTFWEHPFAFSVCVHDRYRDLLTDVFAGRVYEHENQPTVAINDFRRLLGREGERERSYLSDDLYSIPIGSRYHPERAPIWEVNSPVETTERWMAQDQSTAEFAQRL